MGGDTFENMETIEVVKMVPVIVNIDVANLTNKQRKCIEAIEKFKLETCTIPNIPKLCELLGLSSTGSPAYILNILKHKGYDYKNLIYENKDTLVEHLQNELDDKNMEIEHLKEEIKNIIQDRDDNFRRLGDEELL